MQSDQGRIDPKRRRLVDERSAQADLKTAPVIDVQDAGETRIRLGASRMVEANEVPQFSIGIIDELDVLACFVLQDWKHASLAPRTARAAAVRVSLVSHKCPSTSVGDYRGVLSRGVRLF